MSQDFDYPLGAHVVVDGGLSAVIRGKPFDGPNGRVVCVDLHFAGGGVTTGAVLLSRISSAPNIASTWAHRWAVAGRRKSTAVRR